MGQGFLRLLMGFFGFLGSVLDFWDLLRIYGFPWDLWDFGISFGFLGFLGFLWDFWIHCGILWIFWDFWDFFWDFRDFRDFFDFSEKCAGFFKVIYPSIFMTPTIKGAVFFNPREGVEGVFRIPTFFRSPPSPLKLQSFY